MVVAATHSQGIGEGIAAVHSMVGAVVQLVTMLEEELSMFGVIRGRCQLEQVRR